MAKIPYILIVDDQDNIRDPLVRYLKSNGMRVSAAEDGRTMRAQLDRSAIDLIVLDIMMPGEDGLELCKQVRESRDMPVIFLSAMVEDTDKVVGLELGADDYVTKPFNPRELLAHIKAVLRRSQNDASTEPKLADRYVFEGWTVMTQKRELFNPDGVVVPLSTAEYKLLIVFVQRPGMVLNRDQLLDLTAGRQANSFDGAIDNQISRLRKKIEPYASSPSRIKTVRGGGYMFTENVVANSES